MRKILKKVQNGKISPDTAYSLIYSQKVKAKKGRFLLIRIKIKDEIWINMLLKCLFFFPIPIILSRGIVKKVLRKNNVDPILFDIVLKYGGGFEVMVENADVDVYLKVI